MDPNTFNRLIDLLEPHLDETQRRTLVARAFRTNSFYANIDWTGSARAFTVRLLEQLERYGDLQIDDDTVQPALAHLLVTLYSQVGTDVQAEINELLVEMGEPPLSTPDFSTPHVAQVWQQQKTWLVAGVALIALLVAGLAYYWINLPLCQPDQNCVLLAQFTPEEHELAQKTTEDALARLHNIVDVEESAFEVHMIGSIRSESEAQQTTGKG